MVPEGEGRWYPRVRRGDTRGSGEVVPEGQERRYQRVRRCGTRGSGEVVLKDTVTNDHAFFNIFFIVFRQNYQCVLVY